MQRARFKLYGRLAFLLFVVCWVEHVRAAPNSDAEPTAEALPEKLPSATARREETRDHVAAAAWFAQGRVLQQREDLAGALRCYQRAWRWDSRAVSALQEIIPLAMELKREDEAARYALLAGQNAPRDPVLLRRLALNLTEERDWTGAAALYQQALVSQAGGSEKVEDLAGALVRFELGRLYFLSGKYDQSAAAFAQVLDVLIDPAVPLGAPATKTLLGKPEETWLVLGESFLAAGRAEQAAEMFQKANETAASAPLLAVRLARAAAAKKDRDAALKKLDDYFAAKSEAAGTEPYALVSKLLTEGAADAKAAQAEVIKKLKELRQADEKNGPLRFYLAEELLDSGEFAEAEALYRAALADRPRSEVRQRLVELYRRQKNAEKLLEVAGPAVSRSMSLDSLREPGLAIAGDQDFLEKIVAQGREIAKMQREGRPPGALLAAGLLALAGKRLNEAEELLAAEAADHGDKKGELLLAWGLALVGQDQPARAAKVLQPIVDEKLLPEREAAVHYFLAGALALSKDDTRALAAAQRALEIEPANPLYESRVAWVRYHARDLPLARTAYAELVARHADNFKSSVIREIVRDSRLALANVALKQGDFAGAVESLEQVLDEFPEDAGALNDLAYLWMEKGLHLARAAAMAERAVASDPTNASYRDTLGWGYYQLGRYADAARELTVAAEKDPGGVILEHLGDAHLKAGDASKAREAWQRAAASFEKEGEKQKLEAVQGKLK